jgi:hypothetical protein
LFSSHQRRNIFARTTDETVHFEEIIYLTVVSLGVNKIHLSKRLVTFDLDVELAAGHCGDDFSGDNRLDAEIGERTAEDSATEDDVFGREFEVLRGVGDLTEEAEGVVL